MIRYTVVWHEDEQSRLAQIWINAEHRSEVSQATHALDAHLATDAEIKGTAVGNGIREIVIPPPRALYAVSEPDRLVKIVSIWTA